MSKNVLASVPAANEPAINLPASSSDPLLGKLSKHKYAIFSECRIKRDENTHEETIEHVPNTEIMALFVDGDKTMESQWQTPFENSNPELKMPMLMAGLQTGQMIAGFGATAENIVGKGIVDQAAKMAKPLVDFFKSVEGKTNLNKVNTTQVFLSTASVHLNLNLFLMAIYDAKEEVEKKIMQLEAWSVPQHLSSNTTLTDVSANGLAGLFSGIIPPYLALTLHGKTYAPFILQSVNTPLNAPIDKNGNRLSLSFSVNLMSRTAWDAQDVKNLYGETK